MITLYVGITVLEIWRIKIPYELNTFQVVCIKKKTDLIVKRRSVYKL